LSYYRSEWHTLARTCQVGDSLSRCLPLRYALVDNALTHFLRAHTLTSSIPSLTKHEETSAHPLESFHPLHPPKHVPRCIFAAQPRACSGPSHAPQTAHADEYPSGLISGRARCRAYVAHELMVSIRRGCGRAVSVLEILRAVQKPQQRVEKRVKGRWDTRVSLIHPSGALRYRRLKLSPDHCVPRPIIYAARQTLWSL
jgi:hypothetical protein